jgi:hypothetical protein
MTLAKYLDPVQFPLTSQQGLSLAQQRQIDAFNYLPLWEKDLNYFPSPLVEEGETVKFSCSFYLESSKGQ